MDLRRGIGGLMLAIASGDLKIVARRIIRVMCAGELPADEYNPRINADELQRLGLPGTLSGHRILPVLHG